MKKGKDISGVRFGRLVAIKPVGKDRHGAIVWELKCDCGRVVKKNKQNVVSGHTKSCGCLARDQAVDITGKRFGCLVALRPAGVNSKGKRLWEFRCDCGRVVKKRKQDAVGGHTKSCGCLARDKIVDIAGKRFGRLVAIRPTEKRLYGCVVWEFKCDCGNIYKKEKRGVVSGHTKSCGCLKRERTVDITGKRFGRLVAIRPTEKRLHGGRVWEFRCDCGNITKTNKWTVLIGNTRSCGCLRRELSSKRELVDIAGMRFGRLVAIRRIEIRPSRANIWEFRCDCGNITKIKKDNVVRGGTRSCGCLSRGSKSQFGMSKKVRRHIARMVLSCKSPLSYSDIPESLVETQALIIKINQELRRIAG